MRVWMRWMLCACLGVGVAASGLRAEEAAVMVGKPAPDVALEATQVGKVLPDKKDATRLSLKELKGKNVVLFFYPKALTSG